MTAFTSPFNYLELAHEQTIRIIPERWEFGEYAFVTGQNRAKVVTGVRIWLSPLVGERKYHGLPFVDIGQQKLLFDLRPLLAGTIPHQIEFSITAFGVRPKTTYSVSARQI